MVVVIHHERYPFQREKLNLAPVTIKGFCVNGVISEKHSGFKEDTEISFNKEGLVQYKIEGPKFQKMIHLLSQGLFKGVIILCWDRASRNKTDDTLIRKLMKRGIDFRFAYAQYDKTSAGALHMDIDGMFAEHHSSVTSEKVTITKYNLREKGVCTYKAPIGYLNPGNMYDKPFDPDRAPIVKKAFELYVTGGWSIPDLANWCNEQGLTTVPMRRRRTEDEMLAEEEDEVEIEAVSRPMNTTLLHKILENKFYIGKIIGNNGEWIDSISHKALVDEKTFNKVQEMKKKRNISVSYTDKLDHPFRAFAHCEDWKVPQNWHTFSKVS